jgi:3-dehydroquinate synthase
MPIVETIQLKPPPGPGRECPVHFGPSLERPMVEWMLSQGLPHRLVLIADDRVAALHAARWQGALDGHGMRVDTLTFEAGEGSKTRRAKAELEDRMLAMGVGRDAWIAALGGGVTLDLAGFVAATYMRGLPWVALPTTTLAMVDSAIGGKTGVDTPAGKNLIGAFHPPRAVFADTGHLETLPPEVYLEGFAEAIKHGLIASRPHLDDLVAARGDLLARREPALSRLLAASASIKAGFVQRDERETDARRALNFGHTFAHALERLSGWRLSHGQAVARGLLAEMVLSRHLGLMPVAEEALGRTALADFGYPPAPFAGLPPELVPEPAGRLRPPDYLEATRSDKKSRSGQVEYVLLERCGAVARTGSGEWSRPVADDAVLAALFGPARPA